MTEQPRAGAPVLSFAFIRFGFIAVSLSKWCFLGSRGPAHLP